VLEVRRKRTREKEKESKREIVNCEPMCVSERDLKKPYECFCGSFKSVKSKFNPSALRKRKREREIKTEPKERERQRDRETATERKKCDFFVTAPSALNQSTRALNQSTRALDPSRLSRGTGAFFLSLLLFLSFSLSFHRMSYLSSVTQLFSGSLSLSPKPLLKFCKRNPRRLFLRESKKRCSPLPPKLNLNLTTVCVQIKK